MMIPCCIICMTSTTAHIKIPCVVYFLHLNGAVEGIINPENCEFLKGIVGNHCNRCCWLCPRQEMCTQHLVCQDHQGDSCIINDDNSYYNCDVYSCMQPQNWSPCIPSFRTDIVNKNQVPAKFQRNLLQSTISAALRFYQHVPHHGIHQPALVKITSHSALACGRAICKLIHGAWLSAVQIGGLIQVTPCTTISADLFRKQGSCCVPKPDIF